MGIINDNGIESRFNLSTEGNNNADIPEELKRRFGLEVGRGTYEGDPSTSTNFIFDGTSSSNLAVDKANQEESKDKKRDTSHLGIPRGTFGKYSNRRQGGVLRYPLEMMTQETDYLQIDIQKYIPLQNYRSTPGDNSRYVTGNNFTNRAGRRLSQNLSTKPLINDGTILLPIPSDLKDVNSVKYDSDTINGLEALGVTAVESGSKLISDQIGKALTGDFSLQNLGEEAKDLAAPLASAVRDGVGSFKALDNYMSKSLASRIVGAFGGNVSPNALLARGNGEIINPNMELLFGGPTLRNFRFQFKFTPRNEKEAEQIKLIIRAFKRNMAPMAEGGLLGSGNFFLKTPNVFKLRYRTGNKNHPFLNRFKQCFLSDMSVSYTGEGIYSTYEDGTPVSMLLDLSFKETQPIYDIDYDERPGTQAVGY
tara:strand:+ start:2228 stop:3496 length:1269 start_codon:yes stop_codon:yes gene_type:complete